MSWVIELKNGYPQWPRLVFALPDGVS